MTLNLLRNDHQTLFVDFFKNFTKGNFLRNIRKDQLGPSRELFEDFLQGQSGP